MEGAFEQAWLFLKNVPRFAHHSGGVPDDEPIRPSSGKNPRTFITHLHNEILNRPHGVFMHPIGAGDKFKQNDIHDIVVDLAPYIDDSHVGNALAADKLGWLGMALNSRSGDDERYDEFDPVKRAIEDLTMERVKPHQHDEVKRNIQQIYGDNFIKPLAEWDKGTIGNDLFEYDWHGTTLPFDATDDAFMHLNLSPNSFDNSRMHEIISPTPIDPDDYLNTRGMHPDDVKAWMANRVRQ